MDSHPAVDALMAQMTLDEMIGQLNLLPAGEGLVTGAQQPTSLSRRLDAGQVGAIFGTKSLQTVRAMQDRALQGSRLRIPLFFAEDVIHGHRTIFPLGIAQACSWNLRLIQHCAAYAAAEAAAEGLHQVYAPMIDVTRDARWGRVAEGVGEDPHLAARIASAMTRGFQGAGIGTPGRVAACLKHFVAYGAPDSGRDYDNASLAPEDLLETYLPPFAAGVRAGAASVMVAFNAVNKLPMHAHAGLIGGWLRGGQGFDGLVVSDYTGVRELVAHGLGGIATCVARALDAGVDMDMVGEDYLQELPALLRDGLTAPEAGLTYTAAHLQTLVRASCRRVLSFKARLGLLDDPYAGIANAPPAPARAKGRRLARRAAARSAVLLKNNGLLPLPRQTRVALIGPFARDRANMLGTWAVSGRAEDVVTLEEAVTELSGQAPTVAWGTDIVDEPWLRQRLNVHGVTVLNDPRDQADLLAEALHAVEGADVIIAAVGEAKEHAGESSSRLSPDLPAAQARLIAALAQTGKPLLVVVFAGRPLAIGALAEQADALLYAWHGGVAGPEGVADLIYGAAEPAGRLAISLPGHPGEVPLTYAAEPTGRPFPGHFAKFLTGWLDMPDDAPRFPFGFGLGYAPVTYGAPQLSHTALHAGQVAELALTLTNSGNRKAFETVQLYASDPVARITRPIRKLIDFRQVVLAPGESRRLVFRITAEQFRYPLAPSVEAAEWVRDPGLIGLHIGPNSRDTQMVQVTWLS